ncbi:PAS domain S-box protein [Pontibacter mangrovi]|uniref:histidine kinase n=1 Tax=Pontibacter mangrovi TaxID=2589816 RepID=A0A501W713_9BACT|nr:PAS domain S-box protein [Pontibacter mangrovi]TPE43081.1 PAS domain S-box protein [Pontibacter mangrovi]
MNTKETENGYERIIKYIGMSFVSMLLAILLVVSFFFVQTQEMQQAYGTNARGTYKRLELVNNLLENKELTRNLLREHILTEDEHHKDSVRQELAKLHRESEANIKDLHQLLKEPELLQSLHVINADLESYRQHIEHLLQLSNNQRQADAIAYTTSRLAPFYIQNQTNLISLNNKLIVSARQFNSSFFPLFSSLVDDYLLLLLLIVPFIFLASFSFHRITRRLQQENQRLNKEMQEREALQEALELTEQHFKRLFNFNPIPMYEYEQRSLKILEVNLAALKEYGYTREEFLNLTVLDLRPPQEHQRLKDMLQHPSYMPDISRTLSALHMRKDGSTFKAMIRSQDLPERNGQLPRLVIAENVQEREGFVERLEKSEKQLREVSSSIPGAVYRFQVEGLDRFTFPFISDGVVELFGVTPEEVYQNAEVLFKAVHPQDQENVKNSIKAATARFLPWEQDLRIWNKALQNWGWIRGHALPSSRQNGIFVYSGTFIDITDQKEAQAKLIASEANLRALLDSSPQAIYLLDKDLNIAMFNAVAADEVKKQTLHNLEVGQSILRYTAEDHRSIVLESHARALEGETTLFETGCGALWFEVSFRPVLTSDQETIAVALNIHDISEQRRTVAAIKDSELKLSRAQNLAKMGSWEYDLVKDELTISDNMYSIYGLSPQTFIPTFNSIAAFFHPDDKDRILADFGRAIETKNNVSAGHRICLPNGEEKYLHHVMEPLVNDEGRVTRVMATTQDVTEQKQREILITEARDRYQSTLENIPEVIFSSDPKFQINYVSKQCLEITGYSEKEFTTTNFWPSIIHPDDLPTLNERLQQEVLAGERIQHELRIISRDNQLKWLTLRMSPKLDEYGKVVRIDSSAADITERKRTEAKRFVLTEQLQVQNKNLQQFAYIVSHNLRAPIANIIGLTSVYNQEQPEVATNRHIINNLTKSAQHLDRVIRDLNDILTVRGQILDTFERVVFNDLFSEILRAVSIRVEQERAVIEYDFSEAPVIVSLRSYIHSILLNLLTNALKYRSPERKPHIFVKTSTQKDYICIKISDNGLGINLAKDKDKLFGLYKRFHHHIDGRGLGLHLVKTQVELLGGRIDVESEVDVGTTFNICLKSKES